MDYQKLFFQLLELIYKLRDMQTQYSFAEPGHEKNFLLNEIRAQTARIDMFMQDIQRVKTPTQIPQ